MNENIHNVKYFHVGIKKFVRALWCARNFDDINIFSLKRFLYDLMDLTVVEFPGKYEVLVE